MRAYVADAVGDAREFRVGAPYAGVGVLLTGELVQQPVLDILRVDGHYVADIAAGHHLAHHLDHVVAGVGVRDGEDERALPGQGAELLGLRYLEAERLFADHVYARQQEFAADLVVYMVGRADGDEVYFALAPGGLGPGHLTPVREEALRLYAEHLAAGVILVLMAGEAAADQLHPGVKLQGAAVNIADKAVQVSAHHAACKPFCHPLLISLPGSAPLILASMHFM